MTEQAPPLWPDDELIGAADGAIYQMKSGHRYVVAGTLFAVQPDIVSRARVAMTRHVLEHVPSSIPVAFTTYNIDAIAGRTPVPMREKAWALMAEIVRELRHKPGRIEWTLSPHVPRFLEVVRSVGIGYDDELVWLLKYLALTGRIEIQMHSDGVNITLPVDGLIEFEEQSVSRQSNDAFVAMWFNEEVAALYDEAIVPAVERWGYRAVRVDRQEHNNKIDDEIIALIRRANFLIADFSCDDTGARGGVYYEAGFAAGLGKPVIFTVREQDLNRVHFDTRQYNHIVWSTPRDLRAALENRIGATIGEASPLY